MEDAVEALREIKRQATDFKDGKRRPPFTPRTTSLVTSSPLAGKQTPTAHSKSEGLSASASTKPLTRPRKPKTRSSANPDPKTINLDGDEDFEESKEEPEKETTGEDRVAFVPRKPLPATTKAGWGNGQAYSQEFTEFVKGNIEGMPFCVGMIQKLFGVSLKFLYHPNRDPEHLGGKFDKNPSKDVKVMSTVKKKLPKNLLPLEDFLVLECCKGECPNKFSAQSLGAHRQAYTKHGITNVGPLSHLFTPT